MCSGSGGVSLSGSGSDGGGSGSVGSGSGGGIVWSESVHSVSSHSVHSLAAAVAVAVEPSLREKPLTLCSHNVNTVASSWRTPICDLGRRSFVGFKAKPFSDGLLSSWWQRLTAPHGEIEWRRPVLPSGRRLPRRVAWMVAAECRCSYRYGAGLNALRLEPIEFPEWFVAMTRRVLAETGLEFEHFPNCCNVNWYQNGADSVGWHSDDESLFQSKSDDTLILSLSLGQSRKFEVKLMEHRDDDEITTVVLRNGDVLTMEGLFQKYYVHRVPKQYALGGGGKGGGGSRPRINLTWRWIKKHDRRRDRCTLRTPGGAGTVTPMTPRQYLNRRRPTSGGGGSSTHD